MNLWGELCCGAKILASLTTNPSEFFNSPTEGRVRKGMRADLVVLDGGPAQDVKNFAKVSAAIRDGKVRCSNG